jgi:hypothetical protein
MVKKLSAALIAMSLVVVAQSASAQQAVSDQAVTLAAVTLKSGTVNASVTLLNGVVWSFNGSSNIGLTLDGAAAVPSKLKAGMACTLSGKRTGSTGVISTMSCKSA